MSTNVWRFYDFELDLNASRLSRKGDIVHLERIPLELLCLLVERCGQTVTRDQILERIWGKTVFIDSENAINTAVRKIRRALNDDVNAPRFIFTIPGRGYRFIAAASEPGSTAALIRQSEVAATDHGSRKIPLTDSQAGERRHLTVLVCELMAAAGPAPQSDPEERWKNIGDYHRAAVHSIELYGGHVGPYRGDAMMAYFGWPRAHDNDAERAVRAALAIIEGIARLNERSSGPKLFPRIGIDSGVVVLVANSEQNVDLFGDAPSIAVDLQRAAPPGTVLMTAATHRLLSGLFAVEDYGARQRDGIEPPIKVYRAILPRRVRGRLEAVAAAGGLTPFVGREDELRLLMNRWERTLEGEGQAALIFGEPGIGKSRLVHHFHQQIAPTSYTWAETASVPFFENTPFYAVSELLRQLLGVPSGEPLVDQLARLQSALHSCGLDQAEGVPLIAPLLNLSVPKNYPSLTYSADWQRRRLLATLVEAVRGAARTQPLVIAVEDLQWADPSTLELLKLLLEQTATIRILLLFTARAEFHARWALRAHHIHTLSKLSSQDVRTMISHVALDNVLTDDTVATLVDRSGGVPLYVEELTRAVLEASLDNTNRAIPATLHDSLMARLDRLGAAKELAQIAAVIGREFSYELLQLVKPLPEDELQSELEELTEADLVYRRGIPPTYTFKHALIRDAAYESLLKSHRKELHLLVARNISERFPVLKEAHPEVLAQHWSEAGETDLATAEWTRAGKLAQARNAFFEAQESYQYALALLERAVESPTRDRDELDLRFALLSILILTKGSAAPETSTALERVTAVAERIGDFEQLVNLALRRADTAVVSGDLVGAAQLLNHARELAFRFDPSVLAWIHTLEIQISYNLGDLEDAEKHFAAALNYFEQGGFKQSPTLNLTIRALNSAEIACLLGRIRLARERVAQLFATLNRSNPYEVVWASFYAANVSAFLGDYAQAEALGIPALEQAEKLQFPYPAASLQVTCGHAAAHLGRVREGIAMIRRGYNALRQLGLRVGLTWCALCLAEALRLNGELVEAFAILEEGLRMNPDERIRRPQMFALRGELHRQEGDTEAAEADFRTAVELARGMGAKVPELRATMGLARLLRDTGDADSARTSLSNVYSWFTDGLDSAVMKQAKDLLDELTAPTD